MKKVFVSEIYKPEYYKAWYENIAKYIKTFNLILEEVKKLDLVWFDFFPKYKIRFSAYWPGGSYFMDWEDALLIVLTTIDGMFRRNSSKWIYSLSSNPIANIMSIVIFLGIENNLVSRFNLTHNEKKALVDVIFRNIFLPIICKYEPETEYIERKHSDDKLLDSINPQEVYNLPDFVSKYILSQRKENTEIFAILEEAGFSPREAKVYFRTLKLWQSPASTIAKKCEEKRLTTYAVFQDLCKKWIVHEITKDSTKQYLAMTIPKLVEYKEYETKLITRKLESILPSLVELHKPKAQPNQTHTGNAGIISILQTIKANPSDIFGFWTHKVLESDKISFLQKEFLTLLQDKSLKLSLVCPLDEKTHISDFFKIHRNPNITLKFIEHFPIQTTSLFFGDHHIIDIQKDKSTIQIDISKFQSQKAIFDTIFAFQVFEFNFSHQIQKKKVAKL